MTIAGKFGLTLCTSAVLLAAPLASADTLFGIYAGAGTWQQEISGEVDSGFADVDINRDLSLDRDSNNIFYVALEHGLPVLPNIRAQHSAIEVSGQNTLTQSIRFNGATFAITDDVATEVALTQSDAVLYYEVFDNVVSVDVGMAIRWVEGHVEVATSTETARAEFDEIVPLLYAKARVDLPLTGLWAGAEAQGMSYQGNKLIDANAQLGWESPVGLGVEAGWRRFSVVLEDFDQVQSAGLVIDGPYFALNFHF